MCQSFLERNSRASAGLREIKQIVYRDAETLSEISELLGLGPRAVQLIISDLASINAHTLRELLTA